MDEVEMEVSVIVGDVLLADVLDTCDVVVDSSVVVDWVGVEDMVKLVVLMDEVEVEVSVIVGDVLLADVLDTCDVVVDSGVVVDVDWVGVEDKVELVVLMDEVLVDSVVVLELGVVEDELSDVLPDVLLLLIDSVVDSDVLELVGEVDEVSVIVEDRDVLLAVLLLVDSVVISDVLDVAVLEAGLSVISAVGAVLMVVDRDSAVVVDVDW